MGTRRKLLLAALGFVAASTALALWQNGVPSIDQRARRLYLLDNCLEPLSWLSSEEVIYSKREDRAARIYNLRTGRTRALPVEVRLPSPELAFDHPQPYRDNPIPSPDGKWLLYDEGELEDGKGKRRTGWLLVSTDGSEKRRLHNAPPGSYYVHRTLWLPDSSGWYVCEENSPTDNTMVLNRYDLSGKKLKTQQTSWMPDASLAKGRLAWGQSQHTVFSCDPTQFDSCQELPDRFVYPENSSLEAGMLSFDAQQRFLVVRVENKKLPAQDFWGALFNHHFPQSHDEFWLASQEGTRRRCLATAEVPDVPNVPGGSSRWELLAWSRDSKRVVLRYIDESSNKVYLFDL